MIDIHSHILPEVDDGSKSWEMSLHMLRMASGDGIEHMVATPHADDTYSYDRQWLSRLLDELRQRAGPNPGLSLGCDFHFSYENLEDLAEHPDKYTIGATPYLLVEFSDFSIPASVTNKLEELVSQGLRPIITHPERNLILQRSPERVLQWIDVGCAVQVTASALTGLWGGKSKQVANWLLKRQAVHIIATDAHSVDGRPPILSQGRDAAAGAIGAEVARMLVDDNPRAVIEGRKLPYFPPPEI